MNCFLDCECGVRIPIEPRQAGGSVTCACGRANAVPSLSKLRKATGLSAYELDPVVEIRRMLDQGKLPIRGDCQRCGAAHGQRVDLFAECERAVRRGTGQSGPLVWSIVLYLISPPIFLFWYLFLRKPADPDVEEVGRNTTVCVPLNLCASRRGWPLAKWPLWLLRALGVISLVGAVAVLIRMDFLWVVLLVLGAALLALAYVLSRTRQRRLKDLLRTETVYDKLLSQHPTAEIIS